MFKKLLSGLLILVFTTSVFIFILVTSLVILFRPNNIKEWVQESGVYATLSSTIINQGIQQQTATNISFDDPAVQSSIKLALSPKFIESSSETIIDSLFTWLDGSSEKLAFTISTDPVKQVFADDIINYATKRYNSLPACKNNSLPASSDPLTIDCRPPYGVDINQLTADLRTQIMQNEDFLPNSALTADTLFKNAPVLGSNSVLPDIYRFMQYAPYLLAFSLLVTALSAVALNESKRRTVGKVGSILIVSSILAMVALWLTAFGISALRDQLQLQQNSEYAGTYINIVLSILNALRVDMLKTAGVISIAFALLGTIILVYLKLRSGKKKISQIPALKPVKIEKKLPEEPIEAKPSKVKMIKPKQQSAPLVIKPEAAPTPPESQPSPSKKLIQ